MTIKKALKDNQEMEEYQIYVYNATTGEIIYTFFADFTTVDELRNFMDSELHKYNEPYFKLHYDITKV